MNKPVQKSGCAGCPIACHSKKSGGEKDKSKDYAALWSLEPNWPGLRDLIKKYHQRCDDIGLEAFETGRAIALAIKAGAIAEEAAGILDAFDEISRGGPLGRVLGSGEKAAEAHFGLTLGSRKGPDKISGLAPEYEAFLDSLGLCSFAASNLAGNDAAWTHLAEMLSAKLGREMSVAELKELGQLILTNEKRWRD